MKEICCFWFRRDLRWEDNHALYQALKQAYPVQAVFIFDTQILDRLEHKNDARVQFIHNEIERLRERVRSEGADIWVYYGKPIEIWKKLINEYQVSAIYTNRDYEPYARERDQEVKEFCKSKGVKFCSFKDHVIFEQFEVVKDDGDPYVVFTPYKRKWLSVLAQETDTKQLQEARSIQSYPSEDHLSRLAKSSPRPMPPLAKMGFLPSAIPIPPREIKQKVIKEYGEKRNFPAVDGTSRLGIHYRFGTISIREKVRKSILLNKMYLNELIWRDFYSQILFHFPHVKDEPFREKYKNIPWRNDEEEFQAWCDGQTGYPIVDAGMRELNTTGYMHNRVRMITASFLTKHLLIDWRWGEQYFATKLLDYDLASNNGGWQWAAGCGTDAAPYFRIFNPYTQAKKFDKDQKYIKKWVPEVEEDRYPDPIVDHSYARSRCLEVYKAALNKTPSS